MVGDSDVELYSASYGNFATDIYGEIRGEAFGEDIGQTSWLTASEHDQLIEWLDVGGGSRVLDIACGSGGPSLRIARETGAAVVGVDVDERAIDGARARAGEGNSVRFVCADAAAGLDFEDASFDAIICVDAINHLPDRPRVLGEWRRLLAPGGRLVFTDPIVITGAITDEEMRVRSSIGFFLFVPLGLDESLLEAAGFSVRAVEDRTVNMAEMARRWLDARAARETDLRELEGDETFAGQQRFLEVASALAVERRLSRFAFLAERTAAEAPSA